MNVQVNCTLDIKSECRYLVFCLNDPSIIQASYEIIAAPIVVMFHYIDDYICPREANYIYIYIYESVILVFIVRVVKQWGTIGTKITLQWVHKLFWTLHILLHFLWINKCSNDNRHTLIPCGLCLCHLVHVLAMTSQLIAQSVIGTRASIH